MATPYGGLHFRNSHPFRVGREIKFLHNASEATGWMWPCNRLFRLGLYSDCILTKNSRRSPLPCFSVHGTEYVEGNMDGCDAWMMWVEFSHHMTLQCSPQMVKHWETPVDWICVNNMKSTDADIWQQLNKAKQKHTKILHFTAITHEVSQSGTRKMDFN